VLQDASCASGSAGNLLQLAGTPCTLAAMGSVTRQREDQVCREKSSARSRAAWSDRSHPPARQDCLEASCDTPSSEQIGDDILEPPANEVLTYYTDVVPLSLTRNRLVRRFLRKSRKPWITVIRRDRAHARRGLVCRRRRRTSSRSTDRTASGDGGGEGGDGEGSSSPLSVIWPPALVAPYNPLEELIGAFQRHQRATAL